MWDMRWRVEAGTDGSPPRVVLESLNNLHNLLFLCAYPFLFGALGLLLDLRTARQWCLALFPIVVGGTCAEPGCGAGARCSHARVVAAVARCSHPPGTAFGTTLFDVHSYVITICYDTVHVSGIALAAIILASGERVSPQEGACADGGRPVSRGLTRLTVPV